MDPEAPAVISTFYILNRYNGKALTRESDGNVTIRKLLAGSPSQQWQMLWDQSNSCYVIRTGGKRLEVDKNAAMPSGANIQAIDAGGGKYEEWERPMTSDGYDVLQCVASGMVASVRTEDGAVEGANVFQATYKKTTNQMWRMRMVPKGLENVLDET